MYVYVYLCIYMYIYLYVYIYFCEDAQVKYYLPVSRLDELLYLMVYLFNK